MDEPFYLNRDYKFESSQRSQIDCLGNHECVAVINNFVPLEDVSYFTRKQPFEDEPKLKPQLARPIHNLVMSVS